MADEQHGYETGTTTDRGNPGLQKIKPNGQQESYLVLSDDERAKGFVMPVRQTYRHVKCRVDTTMSRDIAETYARNPKFYGGTFCCGCGSHFPLIDDNGFRAFVWVDHVGGPGVNAFVGECQADIDRRLEEDRQKAAEIAANTVEAWPVARRSDALVMYVIYRQPLDHPDKIVTRKFFVTDKANPTHEFMLHDSLQAARVALPDGLYCIPRSPGDEPQIVESWVQP